VKAQRVNASSDSQRAGERAPRFLFASADRLEGSGDKLVPLDIARTPVLRRYLSLDLDNVSIKEALATISRQAGLELAYGDQMAPRDARVRLKAEHITVVAALTDVLLDANVDVVFNSSGRATLVARPKAPAPQMQLMEPVDTVSGVVVDSANNQPLPGVRIIVEGVQRGPLSDAQGRFHISGVSGQEVTLRATKLGYKPLTRQVRVGAANIRFALERAALGLESVIVTASGEQRLREVGSAIERVRVDSAAETAPATNLAELLSSRASGVYIKTGSGSSVGGARIRIRGSSSPSLANEPIVYVDGVRVNTNPASLSYANNQQVPSRFDDINPDEIASIDVLKGPSASTMYGTEAANGVILITTKSGAGASRKAEWKVWAERGLITEPNKYPANYGGVDAAGKACLLTSVAAGTCTQAGLNVFNLIMDPSTTPFKTGHRGSLAASLAGKSGDLNYYFSGERQQEDGVYQQDGVKKTSIRSNFAVHPSQMLEVDLNAGYVSSDLHLFADGGTGLGIVTNGLAGRACSTCWFSFSPQTLAQIDAQQHVDRFIGGVTGHLRPKTWVQMRATIGLDALTIEDQRLFPVGVFTAPRATGQRDVGRNNSLRSTADFLARFDVPLTQTIVSTSSIGGQYLGDRSLLITSTGTGLVPGTNSLSAAGLVTTREQTTEVRSVGAYFEQQFAYRDQLFVTGGLRSDNNSSFGHQFKAIVYPKIGASWVVSDAPFFPQATPISSLRARVSWGQSGSQPGPLNAVTYYGSFPVTTPDGLNQVGVSFEGGNLGNPNLKPERSSELEAGFDIGIMKERFNLTLTHYNKQTKDALVLRQVAPSVGVSPGRWENLSEVLNTGWESTLFGDLYESDAVKLQLTVSTTYNKNKLQRLGEGVAPIPLGTNQRHVQGYPLGGYWMRTLTSYKDANNDGIISPSEVTVTDTAVYLGEVTPPFMGSIRPSLQLFNHVRVNAVIALSRGNKLYNFTEGFRCNGGGARGRNDNCVS